MIKSLIFLTFLLISCSRTELVDDHIIDEIEPNSATYDANEVEEGKIYRGRIGKLKEESDTDLYKIWKPAGTLITLTFESDAEDFQFYVGHTDGAGHGEFVISDAPGRFETEFVTSVNGWQYFEVGDRRNTSAEIDFIYGPSYYFRVVSAHICDMEVKEIEIDNTLNENFKNTDSKSFLFKPIFTSNGYFQLDVDSLDLQTDKAMFLIDCNSGEPAAGNDDESYYDDLIDPLIYTSFLKDGNYVGVVTRLLSDLSMTGVEEFKLSLKKQNEFEELEANAFYNYSNVTGREKVVGSLEKRGDDQDIDWFKFDFFKGQVFSIDVTAGTGESFDAQIWAGAYPVTGSTITPLRFSRLSSKENHHLNMIMPFTGSAYMMLEGDDLEYEFDVNESDNVEPLINFNDKVLKTIETTDCRWDFFDWNMPESGSVFEIDVIGKTSPAGFHVFSSDLLPYAYIEPDENSRFYLHRTPKLEHATFGFYYNNCDQNSNNSMTLRINPVAENFHKWTNGYSDDPVIYDGDGVYQGFIDTDNYYIENSFDIVAPKDGTLYLTTGPGGNLLEYNIDTVIYLYKGPHFVIENDEMIEFLKFNRFSRLTWDVKKGEKYTVKVRPYMTESSNVEAMNIIGNYILDIRIK